MKIKNPEVFRKNVTKHLNNLLDNKQDGENLEKGIYNYTIQEARKKKIIRKWENVHFSQLYIDRFRSIHVNLKNPTLRTRIKQNGFKIHTLAFMSHQEMKPERWKDLIDAKIKRDENLCKVDMSAATDEFYCYKCKNRKCTYYQLQTRSGDEGMTTFVMCLVCGASWKS